MIGENHLIERNLDTAIFEMDEFNYQQFLNRLGGTIKIIRIFDRMNQERPLKDKLFGKISKYLTDVFQGHTGKIQFAVSALSFKDIREISIKEVLNFSKEILKGMGLNSRFVNKDFNNTRPSTIYKARVIEKGVDLCIIKGEKEIFLGESVAIQNIDAYSLRDFDKPKRDMVVGMLPPKLAQILINLAGPKTKTIYDPFCGTGTVLTEGLLMGKDVVGSDVDGRMTNYSHENCEWLMQEFRTVNKFRLFQKDVQELTKEDLPERIDAIVTEGYLGKPMLKTPRPEDQKATFEEISKLHMNWLSLIYPFTPKNYKVVLCLPAFKAGKQIIHLPNFDKLVNKIGYRVLQVFTYDREDQVVARDIKVLEKL